jgi:hypothetical protein
MIDLDNNSLNGVILIPICKDQKTRECLFKKLNETIDVTYVGIKDVLNLDATSDLKSKVIISNFKTYVSLNKKYIFIDCETDTPQQRRVFIKYAKISNYIVVGIIVDINNEMNILRKNNPEYDEGFEEIIYLKGNICPE